MPKTRDSLPYWAADSAQIAPEAVLSESVKIWDLAQIREKAKIGAESVVGRGVYVDHGVEVGDRCKIQNGAQIFSPARVGAGVFIGPGAILSNDPYPRAITPDGALKRGSDWDPIGVTIEDGASVGAGAVIIGGITVHEWAVVGAGATVTRDVPAFALVLGTPARRVGWVGRSGIRLQVSARGYLEDSETGDRFIEESGKLEEIR